MNKQIEEHFSKLAETLAGIHERAVIEYTPLVNDICSRKATEDEVDNLLTWMFDFVENEQMLLLFKKVCRTYLYTYPEVVGFYIMEYRVSSNFVSADFRKMRTDSFQKSRTTRFRKIRVVR